MHYQAFVGDDTFQITFKYDEPETVSVYIGDELLTPDTDYTYTTTHTIKLLTPLTEDARVTIRRDTVIKERAVDFTNAAELTEADLDNSANQVFYAMQEAADNSVDSLKLTPSNDLDAQHRRIVNVNTPTDDKDASNKSYVDIEVEKFAAQSRNDRIEATHQADRSTEQADRSESEADRSTAQANRAENEADRSTSQADIATSVKDYVLAKTDEGIDRLEDKTVEGEGRVEAEGQIQIGLATDEADRAHKEANRAAASATLTGIPLGSYVWFPAYSPDDTTDRYGLLIPDGRELSRSTYEHLWKAIERGELPSVSEAEWQEGQQTVFSTGDGVTTFRLPSISGYFAVSGEGTVLDKQWMQPYIVWYQASNTQIGGFRLRGSWDAERNLVIGDPLNASLTQDVPPNVEAGATTDGLGYLVVTDGHSDLTGNQVYMKEGDRVIWYSTMWVHVQHSDVTSVNGENGDVVLTTEDINRPSGVSLEETLSTLFPVGSVVLRMDATNPSTLYGGTWSLITGDASLSFGDGSQQSGTPYGNNTPAVPVPRHSHSASFKGNALPAHGHSLRRARAYDASGSHLNYNKNTGHGGNDNASVVSNTINAASAGTPTGSVTVNASGTSNVTLDVRGARIAINVWQRTE